MNGMLTYEQAAARTPFEVKTLRHHAGKKTPPSIRLRVERFGHRTVFIREVDLRDWLQRKQRAAS